MLLHLPHLLHPKLQNPGEKERLPHDTPNSHLFPFRDENSQLYITYSQYMCGPTFHFSSRGLLNQV